MKPHMNVSIDGVEVELENVDFKVADVARAMKQLSDANPIDDFKSGGELEATFNLTPESARKLSDEMADRLERHQNRMSAKYVPAKWNQLPATRWWNQYLDQHVSTSLFPIRIQMRARDVYHGGGVTSTNLELTLTVPDRNTGTPVDITFGRDLPELIQNDEEEALRFLHFCLKDAVLHELDEWITVRGERVFNPHAEEDARREQGLSTLAVLLPVEEVRREQGKLLLRPFEPIESIELTFKTKPDDEEK